jgi:hypothetical protein
MKVPTYLVTAVALLAAGSAYADAATCRAEVLAAAKKSILTPNHTYTTQVIGPKKLINKSESINIGTKSFNKMVSADLGSMKMADGGWTLNRLSPQQTARIIFDSSDDDAKSIKNYQCARARDETIEGVAATLYQEHAETEAGKADTQTWISKGQGLVVEGIVTTEEATSTTRYVYTNVQAPADAKGHK